jgi:hypothetical protein
MSNNILEPIPSNLNDYLLKYNKVTLSSTTPAAPGGSSNVTFQMDGFGNISAYSSGGASAGTVTSVSTTVANGISATVTNPTTTPSIALALGDITPNSVTANGVVVANLGSLLFGYQNTGVLAYGGGSNNVVSLNGSPDGNFFLGMQGGGHLQTGGIESLHFNVTNLSGAMGSFIFSGNNTTIFTIDGGSGLVTAGSLALTATTTATSATAGAATALPATPLGYVEVTLTLAGTPTVVKLPYYSV